MGFHTIQLDSFISIKEGDEFTVKIKSDSAPILINSRQYYIENSSQYLENGTWINAPDYGRICCIKVYTIDEARQDTALAAVYDVENGALTATLTDDEGNAISDAKVGFNIGDDAYIGKTDSEGQVMLLTKGFAPGTYTAIIYYNGDVEYNPSNTTLDFTVKADIMISAVYNVNAAELVVTFTNNATGKPVSNANIQVSLNGNTTTVKTNSKGQAKVSTFNLPYGEYTANVSYAGNAKYNPVSASIDFSTKENMVISAIYNTENKEIVATLTNVVTGKVVTNAKVRVNLNGADYTLKTNSKGQIKVSTADLPLGTYIATISYAGNSKYDPANTTVSVAIKTDVIISDIYCNEYNFTAKLTNAATGNPVSNAKVVFKVNGVTTTVKSNSKGQIRVSNMNPTADTYNITISYAGNNKYNPSSVTATHDRHKTYMDISTVYNKDKQELKATLQNARTVKPVNNANVEVTLNGITSTFKTNSKGQITVSTKDLNEGIYVAIISYAGNSKYNPTSTVARIDA